MAIDREQILDAAQKYADKKRYDKAVEEYWKLVKADPGDARTLLRIGDLQVKAANYAEAISTYESVGRLYASQGFALKAIAVYKQIREIVAKYTPTATDRYAHIPPKLAELYEQLGLAREAVAVLDEVAVRLQGQRREREATEVVRRMTSLEPHNPLLRIRLAEAQLRMGDKAGATEELGRAATILVHAGRRDDAIKVLQRALHVEHDDARARELASLYIASNSKEDALRALSILQPLIQDDARNISSLSLLASAFDVLGQTDKSTAVRREMASVMREAPLSEAPEPFEVEDAPPEGSVDVNSVDDALAHAARLRHGQDYVGAYELLVRVITLAPERIDLRESLRETYLTAGDAENAAEVTVGLAELYLEQGNVRAAKVALTDALAYFPSHELAQSMLDDLGGPPDTNSPRSVRNAPRGPLATLLEDAESNPGFGMTAKSCDELELGEALEEVEFYLGSALFDDAESLLSSLEQKYVGHMLVAEKRRDLEAAKHTTASVPSDRSSDPVRDSLGSTDGAFPTPSEISADAVFDEFQRSSIALHEPNDALSRMQRAQAERDKGNADDALREFLAVLDLNELPPAEEARAQYEVGSIYDEYGLSDDAAHHFGLAERAMPGFKDAAARSRRRR